MDKNLEIILHDFSWN